MKNYNIPIIAICLSSIALGILLVIQFHTDFIHPIDKARGTLSQVQATSDPVIIRSELVTVKGLLPASGNPVWISPTEDTDFRLMQRDLQTMLGTVDEVANTSPDSAAFHAGMLNIHTQASAISFNLIDVTPYLYARLPFVLANSMWLLGVMGLVSFVYAKKK